MCLRKLYLTDCPMADERALASLFVECPAFSHCSGNFVWSDGAYADTHDCSLQKWPDKWTFCCGTSLFIEDSWY